MNPRYPILFACLCALVIFVWSVGACVVPKADLECRPCSPEMSCGEGFRCQNKICRPLNSVRFRTCEMQMEDAASSVKEVLPTEPSGVFETELHSED